MSPLSHRFVPLFLTIVAHAALTVAAAAQAPPASTPAPTAAAAPAPTPPGARLISGIRNKLSAADLRSAESMAETWKNTQSDDGSYLLGLSWVARGAYLLGEFDRAEEYVAEVRRRCDARMARGVRPDQDDSLEIALGAAIEVEAQLLARERGKGDAVRFLQGELDRHAGLPVALRSRIRKRMNLIDLEGKKAPEWVAETHAGATPPTLSSLRGKPVLVYVWDKGCGDCRALAPTLSRVAAKHAGEGLAVVPITRFFEKDAVPGKEIARIDSVWTEQYQPLGPTSVVIGNAAMEAYGGSSTPTLVLIDKKGVVRKYSPYRLTERDLEAAIALAMK